MENYKKIEKAFADNFLEKVEEERGEGEKKKTQE